MISRRLLVFAGLLLAGAVNAQPFTHPLGAGTLLRYRTIWHTSQQQRDTSLTLTIQSPTRPFGEQELDSLRPNVTYYDWFDLFSQQNVQYRRRTDRATIQVYVTAFGERMRIIERYPADPPPGDTITLHERIITRISGVDSLVATRLARVIRHFDTTLFDVTTRAFSVVVPRDTVVDTFTIADGFGVVMAVLPGEKVTFQLSAACIGRRSYNWGPVDTRWFPLAVGNEWHYRGRYKWFREPDWLPFTQVLRSTDTTVFLNHSYFQLSGRWDGDLHAIREDTIGVLAPSFEEERVILHAAAGVGTVGEYLVVTSREKSVHFGTQFTTLKLKTWNDRRVIRDVWETWEYLEGVGLARYTRSAPLNEMRELEKELVYARVGDITYGTPLQAEAADAPAPDAVRVDGTRPHPLHRTAPAVLPVSLMQAEQVTITLHDLLGRRVLDIHDGLLPAGETPLRLQFHALPSGTYMAVVRTPGNTTTRTLILLP
jgi:hypothetical protein